MKKSHLSIALHIQNKLPIFQTIHLKHEISQLGVFVHNWLLFFLRIVPLFGKLFIRIILTL